jgi:hypothetical protein
MQEKIVKYILIQNRRFTIIRSLPFLRTLKRVSIRQDPKEEVPGHSKQTFLLRI